MVNARTLCTDKQQKLTKFSLHLQLKLIFILIFHLIWNLIAFQKLNLRDFPTTLILIKSNMLISTILSALLLSIVEHVQFYIHSLVLTWYRNKQNFLKDNEKLAIHNLYL